MSLPIPEDFKIIDLTHMLIPKKERFRLDINQYFVDEYIQGYQRRPNDWYIMQEIQMSTHVGTHVESPYHHYKNGNDISKLRIDQLIGTALLVDLSKNIGEFQPITMDHILPYKNKILEDDIVLIRTGFSKNFRTNKYPNRPYIELEVISWLIKKKIKCLGIDCSGIENKKSKEQRSHIELFKKNIPLIEDLNNLDKITVERFFFIALPLYIIGMDASPIRAIAIL